MKIFNFTEDFQFSTRLYLENKLLEIINETKLLGTIITTDLKWYKNTEMLVKKSYQRMMILHKLYAFKVDVMDLVNIYILYIRSLLEQSCQVWHFSISEEEVADLERVQKVACRIILQNRYETYDQALDELKLQKLTDRRNSLCLKFAKKCVKHDKSKELFPLNLIIKSSEREKYQVQHAKTTRLL